MSTSNNKMTGMTVIASENEDQTYLTEMTGSYGEFARRHGSIVDEDSSSRQSETNNNAAEVKALVKRENHAVHLLRGIVLAVLICAAVVSAKLVYNAFSEKSYDAYEEEYEAVSTRLVELYRQDVLQKLWLAQNIAAQITTLLEANQWNATQTTIPSFDSLVSAAVVLGPVDSVRWSPLLETQEKLDAFQTFANQHHGHDHGEGEMWHHVNQSIFRPHNGQLPASPVWQMAVATSKAAGSHSDSDDEEEEHESEDESSSEDRRLIDEEEHASSEEEEASHHEEREEASSEDESDDEHHHEEEEKSRHIEDLMANPVFRESIDAMVKIRGPVMSRTYIVPSKTSGHTDDSAGVEESEDASDESEDQIEDTVSDSASEDDRRFRGRRRHLSSSSDSSSDDSGEPVGDGNERAMTLFFPVFDTKAREHIVGSVSLTFLWSNYLSGYALIDSDLVREENVFDTDEVDVILENTCGQIYTLKVDHGAFHFVGEGDLHVLDDLVMSTSYEDFDAKFAAFAAAGDDYAGTPLNGHCRYRFISYPTEDIWYEHHTEEPFIFALVVAMIFVFSSTIFVVYDCIVSRRQRIITRRAMQTNAIVSSLFPENVRKRMYGKSKVGSVTATPKRKLTSYLDRSGSDRIESPSAFSALSIESTPIADLFPHCTVLFADIAGFTAWSSEREPSQTFQLLERTFGDFDRTARKLGVFKVETIGDCYMCVTGLPTARDDHAVVAARFARIINFQMQWLCKDLENSLGPSTADLHIRIGLHSGPVTAGVLRGEKSRFQLFGDTVNTASRMESSGVPGKIHVSSSTAEELRRFGFDSWLTAREDTPYMKGLGQLKTFFVATQEASSSDKTSHSCMSDTNDRDLDSFTHERSESRSKLPRKFQRLVNWNVDLLAQYLKAVVAHRQASTQSHSNSNTSPSSDSVTSSSSTTANDTYCPGTGQYQLMNDMVEVLALPAFDEKVAKKLAEISSDNDKAPSLSDEVLSELQEYVGSIASLYRDVPFHNYIHASHVALSSMKLLNRIVTPEDVQAQERRHSLTEQQPNDRKSNAFLSSLTGKNKGKSSRDEIIDHHRAVHKATYGIGSDSLMQFSILFAALIHDVDHQGVPNAQLCKEESSVAMRFQNKSVAEQNSIDIALTMLRESRFDALRKCIAPTDEEWTRFRQLIVVAVMSTDIASAELRQQRADKWDKAFVAATAAASKDPSDSTAAEGVDATESTTTDGSSVTLSDRRATAVLEQVIQASDVSHTMQHWHTYIKWNQRLFEETYRNYILGRAEKDPVEGWYEGEIGFFDFYIIPLAKKLETCGVFGVSKDEYLIFASENRKEWELKGREVVANIHKQCQEKYGTCPLKSARFQATDFDRDSDSDIDRLKSVAEFVDC